MTLRLVFMGTPDFSVAALEALGEAGHELAAVYTQPPRPAGRRGLDLTKSPVHLAAEKLGLPVRTPATLKVADEQEAFRALEADAAVVVAYGLLLPKVILDGTRHGAFNIHASLLPRWRGAAPIQRAIMAGDTETGISIMKMDESLDTGPVALEERVAVGAGMTAGVLHDVLRDVGARLIVQAMALLEQDELSLTPQVDHGATYAKKIAKGETRIDWSRPARQVHDHIRGLSPFPGAWCELRGTRVKVLTSTIASGDGKPGEALDAALTIACGDGAIRIERLQRAGGKALAAADFLAGTRVAKGTVLS